MKSRLSFLAVSLVLFVSGCMPPAQQTGADGKAQAGPFGTYGSLIFMGAIFLVFWLFFIRPQAKKAKDQKKFIDELQKGDKIVTIAGIHGVVNKMNEDGTISMEISPGSYIKIEKSAISKEWTAQVNKPATATPEKK